MSHKMTLGVDFGGSSSKATLLDETGKIICTSSKEYPSYYPQPGWCEQDADDLYDAFLYNVQECLKKSGVDPADICAVALDAATHMAVLCDEYDKPVRKFIHWSDNRCTVQVAELKKNHADLIAKHSCNSVSPAWTLPQLMWLREHEPEAIEKTRRVYFAKDYVRSRITGDYCTDSIEIMGAMLADDNTMQWNKELCALVGLDAEIMPEIKEPSDLAGYVTAQASALTGLKEGTPVIVGTTDTVLEVFASGSVEVGCATVKLATAGRICPITNGAINNPQFFNYRHIVPGLWYPGTTSRTCAASYKWYRDVFGSSEIAKAEKLGISSYELLNREAEKAPVGSDNLFFHPFLLGELTPYYDDLLRASFIGVRMHHTKGYFSRAVMEGISYSMRDCLEQIKLQNIPVEQYRIIGGGAKGKLWRQILCDILATDLTSTENNDSSLGSAMLAGIAVGIFTDELDAVRKCVQISDIIHPIPGNVEIYEKGFNTYREIVKAVSGVYHGSGYAE